MLSASKYPIIFRNAFHPKDMFAAGSDFNSEESSLGEPADEIKRKLDGVDVDERGVKLRHW